MKKNRYFFTFGSSDKLPFNNSYLIVKAENIRQAVSLFRVYFPDRTDGFVNCSDYYTEADWENDVKKYYKDCKPKAIITSDIYKF
nr:MAG TPA: hypothetical protein [Caudoviricetes sp.]